ncbi:MAG: flagellar hook-associated protein 2 [Caryophanon sp.]|nr:flagellar hook-associated protein 2 [Caryophanon sp.]
MVMRIGGLASGMDIDSIVEKLMQAEKAPLNKLYQNKQKYEWQRDAYRDVNTKLQAFDDFLFNDMTLSSSLNKKTVVSTNSAVSAVPTTAANNQSLSIDSVDQLARSGSKSSDIGKNVDTSTMTMEQLNPSFTGTQQVEIAVLQSNGKLESKKFEVSATDTIDNVLSKFKDAGLNAFYDKQSGKLGISTQATGVGSLEINVPSDPDNDDSELVTCKVCTSAYVKEGQNVFESLGLGTSANLINNGQNAKLTVNGIEIERTSNTFELDGFNVTLNNTYSANNNAQPISLTSKVDADNMVDKIKKFVETYNGMIASFSAQVKEPKYRDYTPLTDEQKVDMDEKEIEQWEKKAKSGVLRGDSVLNSVLSKMRGTMYSNGGGKQDDRAAGENFINTLYEMGITTSNKTSEAGKLIIDEEKLRAAIEKDPDQVFKTFSDTSKETPGLVQKLREDIKGTIASIEKKAGRADAANPSFQIGRSIRDADNRIDHWKEKLANIEQRYWKQFTAMEQAISKGNAQSSSLFSGQTM